LLESRCTPTTLVAIIDTGIDLNSQANSPYYDFTYAYDAYNMQTAAQYGNGVVSATSAHGTVVTDLVVRGIQDAKAVPGAQGADVKIMPIRASSGDYFVINALIRGIYWAADHSADVINLSFLSGSDDQLLAFGDPHNGSYLSQAIRYAETTGAIVVGAPGNANVDIDPTPRFPPFADDAAFSHASPLPTNLLIAAAVTPTGELSPVSSWGPVHVDIGAPTPGNGEGATSYSAAYTSGVSGVIAALTPSWTPSQQVGLIKTTVVPRSQSAQKSTAGNWSTTNGIINCTYAVQEATSPNGPIAINAGGSVNGAFLAETGAVATSGNVGTTTNTINVTGVNNAAPQAVYQSERYGDFKYIVPGLTVGNSYTVRLHFSENYFNGVGQRLFNVKINGTQVLTNFDIYAQAGNQQFKAVVREFSATADAAGRMTTEFLSNVGGAKLSGIEIIPNLPAPTNLTATTVSSSQINLSWSAVAGATSYQVERSPNGSSGWNLIGSPAGTSSQDTGLSAGTTYYYRVRAVLAGVATSPSVAASATTTSSSTLVDRTLELGIIPSARGENGPAESKVQAFDNNVATKWLDFSATSWLLYRLANPRVITQYTITSANDSPERDPKSWTFKGSNNGVTWTNLDSRSIQVFANRYQSNTYSFSNATEYTYYKLDSITNNSGSIIQLAEFRLSGPITASLSAKSLGQDGRDYIGSGAGSTAADGYQDIHLVVDGLPLDKTIDWIKVGGVGGGEWRYNGASGTDKAVLARAVGTSIADLYVQPYQDESTRSFAVTVYYTDGTNSGDLYTNVLFGGWHQSQLDRTSLAGGTTSARGQNAPTQVIGNLFDNNMSTSWLDFSSTSWVQYQFASAAAYAVTQYTVTSGGDTAAYPGRAPKSWELKGSNDGTNWTTLDVRTNEANTANVSTRTYSFDNTSAYKMYRMDNILSNGDSIVQLTEVRLLGPPAPTELAAGKPAYASSIEGAGYEASKAVDGNGTTRWSSGQWMQGGNQVGWIYVDLGASYNICQVSLNWEAAYAVNYQIQVSNDASNWKTVRSINGNGSSGVLDYTSLAARGRYVRIYCTQVNATNNYSLYDFKVYGS
jgi:hypothetical protein